MGELIKERILRCVLGFVSILTLIVHFFPELKSGHKAHLISIKQEESVRMSGSRMPASEEILSVNEEDGERSEFEVICKNLQK